MDISLIYTAIAAASCILTIAALTTLAESCLKALISLRASQIILIYSLLALALTAPAYAQ